MVLCDVNFFSNQNVETSTEERIIDVLYVVYLVQPMILINELLLHSNCKEQNKTKYLPSYRHTSVFF